MVEVLAARRDGDAEDFHIARASPSIRAVSRMDVLLPAIIGQRARRRMRYPHSAKEYLKKIWVRGQFVEVTDEVYTAYMRGDRKMRYFEADLKSERPVYGSNGEIKQVLPSREDSLDRLMEENARQFAAAAESVEDVVIRKLAVDKLHTALMQLTKEERDFICALFFDEKTESEVAKGLGVSQQAVHKRKSRILKKLKNFFE